MKRIDPITPPGFAKVRGEKGRIFYKILYPAYEWIDNLHQERKNDLGIQQYLNQCQCVKPHLRRRFMLKLDLKHAFDSVTPIKANQYADVYFEKHEEYFFHKDGGLIQGAPASPLIFHVYCQEMLDPTLELYCQQQGLLVTRYVDDILISSQEPICNKTITDVEKITTKALLILNGEKTKCVDNKFQSIVFVGIRIFNHKVRPEDAFLKELHYTNPGDKSYFGMKKWEQDVLALNH